MSKFGWSYPPGCSGPPEDPAGEALAEAIDQAIMPLYVILPRNSDDSLTGEAERAYDDVCLALCKLIEEAHAAGFADGAAEEGMAREAELEARERYGKLE